MTREIKFRAWNKRKKEWYKLPSWGESEADGNSMNGEMTLVSNEFFEWSQYTGLKDKNGVLIYEGDILNFGEDVNLAIEWAWNSYNFHKNADWDITNYDEEELEVVGNIYENENLLTQSNKE